MNGTRLGGEVRLSEAGEVALEIESAAAVSIPVDVLVNGVVAATIPVEPGVQVTKAKLPVSKSAWISVRSASRPASAPSLLRRALRKSRRRS